MKDRIELELWNQLPDDAYALADVLKLWFRELPEPVLSEIPVPELLHCADSDALLSLVQRYLTTENQHLFLWSLGFFRRVVEQAEWNGMTAPNCAIVFVPNLMHCADLALASQLNSHLTDLYAHLLTRM